jgi:hypothetical protein
MILYDTTLSLMINIRYMTHTHIHDESILNILLIYGTVVYLVSSINIYIINFYTVYFLSTRYGSCFRLPIQNRKEGVSDFSIQIKVGTRV